MMRAMAAVTLSRAPMLLAASHERRDSRRPHPGLPQLRGIGFIQRIVQAVTAHDKHIILRQAQRRA